MENTVAILALDRAERLRNAFEKFLCFLYIEEHSSTVVNKRITLLDKALLVSGFFTEDELVDLTHLSNVYYVGRLEYYFSDVANGSRPERETATEGNTEGATPMAV